MNKFNLADRFTNVLFSRFKTILFVYALLLAFAVYSASRIKFESSFENLLPRSFESVKALDDITKEFGGTGYLVLVVESEDLEKSKKFSADLVEKLEKLPEVKYVNWRQPKKYFDDRRLLYLELEDIKTVKERIKKKIAHEKQKANPLFIDVLDEEYELDLSDIEKKYEGRDVFRDYYVSKDGRELVLLVKPAGLAGDLSFSRRLVANAEAAAKAVNPAAYHPSIKVSLTGRYKKQIDLNDQLTGDVKLTIFGSLVLGSFLLFLHFRQPGAVLLIGLPLVSGIIMALAFGYFAIGYLNIISAFLFSILMGIGMDYGIVFYSRYAEEKLAGLPSHEAMNKTFKRTGRSILIAAFSTGAAFFSLAIAEFKGFSQFGLIAGAGVFFNMLVFFTLMPALIVAFEKIKPPRYSRPFNFKLGKGKTFIYGPILAVSLLFTAYSLARMNKVGFEYNFSKIQGANIPSFVLDERVNGIIGTSLTPDLVMTENLEEVRAASKVLEEKEKNPDTTIDMHASILSFLPEDQKERIKELREIRKLLDDGALNILKGRQREKVDEVKKLLEVGEVRKQDLPREILRMFCGSSPERSALFIFPKVNLSDASLVKKSSDEIRDLQIPGKTLHPCSESIIFSDILNMIEKDGKLIMLLSFLATSLPIILAYRAFKSSFFILTPLFVSILWILGVMALFDMKFNFFNVLILPLIFGLGVDYGEYIYSRYKEEGAGSVPFVLNHTGPAVLMSALTTALGFGTLLFADHSGLKSIGVMAVSGISCAFLCAVLLLPSVLVLSEKLRKS